MIVGAHYQSSGIRHNSTEFPLAPASLAAWEAHSDKSHQVMGHSTELGLLSWLQVQKVRMWAQTSQDAYS